jgi:hypothetical protein
MKNCHQEPIVLDGGNVVASQSQVILTENVFKENPSFKPPHLRKRLAELYKADSYTRPQPWQQTPLVVGKPIQTS